VSAFLSVAGTGGQLMGVERVLRRRWPNVILAAVRVDGHAWASGSASLAPQDRETVSIHGRPSGLLSRTGALLPDYGPTTRLAAVAAQSWGLRLPRGSSVLVLATD
jgi:hypothetical protein